MVVTHFTPTIYDRENKNCMTLVVSGYIHVFYFYFLTRIDREVTV